MEKEPVVKIHVYNTSPAEVWRALTELEEIRHWYFDLAEFRAENGFRFQFTGTSEEGVPYLHLCEVTEVIPEKKLTYSWRYDGYEGISWVTFELFAQDNTTTLELKHEGLETFPQDNKDFAAANFDKGWDEIIHQSLTRYLETKSIKS